LENLRYDDTTTARDTVRRPAHASARESGRLGGEGWGAQDMRDARPPSKSGWKKWAFRAERDDFRYSRSSGVGRGPNGPLLRRVCVQGNSFTKSLPHDGIACHVYLRSSSTGGFDILLQLLLCLVSELSRVARGLRWKQLVAVLLKRRGGRLAPLSNGGDSG